MKSGTLETFAQKGFWTNSAQLVRESLSRAEIVTPTSNGPWLSILYAVG